METITGIFQDRLSSEQNADGKFDVMIKRDKGTYRTGFIFDSIKLMSEFAIRTCQIDPEGNKKFGVVTVCSEPMYFPCIFDKVKPYKGQIIQVFIGEEDYYMDRFGQVFTKEFMEIRNL